MCGQEKYRLFCVVELKLLLVQKDCYNRKFYALLIVTTKKKNLADTKKHKEKIINVYHTHVKNLKS